MFITNSYALLHLWWKEIWLSNKSSQNIMSMIVCKISFSVYVFINCSNCHSNILAGIYLIFLKSVLDQAWAQIVINSHILAGIYLIFLENVLDQTWRSLKTDFGPQQKYWKRSYQVRQNLALFCNLVALILGWYCVNSLMVAKFIREIGLKEPGAS